MISAHSDLVNFNFFFLLTRGNLGNWEVFNCGGWNFKFKHVCLLVRQNFLVGTYRYLSFPGGGWRLLSPDTVTARRKMSPVKNQSYKSNVGVGSRRNIPTSACSQPELIFQEFFSGIITFFTLIR